MKIRILLALSVLATYCAPEQGAPPGQQSTDAPIRSTTTLVVVPTVVRTASGELITKLRAGDFRVTDNGALQTATAETVQNEPIALVVVMQTGGAAPGQFQNYRTLNTLVTAMIGASDHRVALVTFDSHLQEIWNFPPRVDGLKHAFKNPESGDHGAAILDALNCGIGMLEHQSTSLRRVILLLSQSRDNGSETSPLELLHRLGESNTTVYSVTFPPEKKGPKLDRSRDPNNPSLLNQGQFVGTARGTASLQTAMKWLSTDTALAAAALSGGEQARLKNKDDLERSLSVLANDFTNSYTLTFHPDSDEPGFHWIKVQLGKERGRPAVEARMLYWRNE